MLAHLEARDVKVRRFRLHPHQRRRIPALQQGRQVAQVQRRRLEETRGRDPQLVALDVVDGRRPHRARQVAVDAARLPLLTVVVEHQQVGADILLGGDHDEVPGDEEVRDRRQLRRGEQHPHTRSLSLPAGQERLQPRHGEGPRRHQHVVDLPVGAGREQQQIAVGRGRAVGGDVDQTQRVVGVQQEQVVVVEAADPVDPVAHEIRHVIATRADLHVRRFALVDEIRLRHRHSPVPATHLQRIPGAADALGSKIGGDEHRVGVDPAEAALRGGPFEPALGRGHEPFGDQIELAGDVRVGTTVGQGDQGVPPRLAVLRAQHGGAVPHPVLLLRRVEGVDVDQHLPVGLLGAVRVHRRAPPQSPWMLRVGPEVVQLVAAAHHVRDARRGVEDRFQLRRQCRRLAVRVEFLLGARVVLAHPFQRVIAGHVLEPQPRVGGAVAGGQAGISGLVIAHGTRA